jgi:hypothetical protein
MYWIRRGDYDCEREAMNRLLYFFVCGWRENNLRRMDKRMDHRANFTSAKEAYQKVGNNFHLVPYSMKAEFHPPTDLSNVDVGQVNLWFRGDQAGKTEKAEKAEIEKPHPTTWGIHSPSLLSATTIPSPHLLHINFASRITDKYNMLQRFL